MFEFLFKVWGLARRYRTRLILGVLMGVVSGLLEPLMVVTIVFVYGSIFPSQNEDASLVRLKDLSDPPALVRQLSQSADPVSRYLWNQFPQPDQQKLTNAATATNEVARVLATALNRQVQCGSLSSVPLFEQVHFSRETLRLMQAPEAGAHQAELNRALLSDAYPELLARSGNPAMPAQLSWAPDWAQKLARWFESWTRNAQEALRGQVRSHWAAAAALVLLIPLVILLRSLVSYLNVYFLQWTAIRTITDLRTRLFAHLMGLSAGFFSRTRSGELMSRILSDTGTLQGIISNATPVIVKDPVTLLSLLAYLLCKEPKITLISMIIMPVCMVPVLIYNKKVRRAARAMQNQSAELSSVMSESFTGYRAVKAYNLEDTMVQRFRATAANFIGHYMRIVRSAEIPGPLLEFVGSLGVALVLIYLMVQTETKPTSTSFLAVIISIFSMYRPLKNITRLYNTLEQARAASERVFHLLATVNEVREPAQPRPLRAGGSDIRFDHLDFFYGDKPILRQIQLTVPAGKLVALVGPSGSGKTTLANLLLRFYDPQTGAVRIGEVDIRDVKTQELRSQIALVAQDTILFNDSIRHNIALGRPGASDAEIEAAARHANAHQFIMERPEGYETVVGEKGMALSGGQRQRIAIARALLRNAPILVLDEATSALDTESERAVQADLEELMKGRTTICIAHRLSTIQKADLIVVMDQGRIVETGTHGELLRHNGLYCKLYQLSGPAA